MSTFTSIDWSVASCELELVGTICVSSSICVAVPIGVASCKLDCRGVTSCESKSGAAGDSIDERASQWHYYDRMNFLKTFIGSKKLVEIDLHKVKYLIILTTGTCTSILTGNRVE